MRIHEVEIYTSKQIDAFIEYLKVLSSEKKLMEDMQSHYTGNALMNANCIGGLGVNAGAAATPEYLAKLAAQREAETASQKSDG